MSIIFRSAAHNRKIQQNLRTFSSARGPASSIFCDDFAGEVLTAGREDALLGM